MSELLSVRHLPKLSLNRVIEGIEGVSTLPQVALRVMEVANDPESGAAELKKVMEGDAALSARVLQCVNSSAYATRTKITNLQQAIAYLGTKQIRNLAITASVSELFSVDETIGTYRRIDLWRHLVSVGICSRLIALRLRLNNFEDFFLAGLLHDIGIILEDQHVHDHFLAVIGSLDDRRTLAQVERDLLGFDHTMLGEKMAEFWNFPKTVTTAIRHHHMSAHYRGDDSELVRCVEVANLICSLKGITSVGMQLVRFSKPAMAALSLSKEDMLILSADLDKEVAANQSLFQV
ncbi:MAG: HDOD domain-containing protein [Candidatus Nealsonbacteria bacterium]|nr:HDOD domain-containing protein [Candidatus Nealsonbacteria bacterium]